MIRHMKGAAAAAMLATVPAMASPVCMQPREAVADKVRYVQIHLNVAALLCRDTRYRQLTTLYNSFILKNRGHLISGRPAIESFVARRDMTIDTYLTRRFNKLSFASMQTDDFCGRALMAARQAIGSPDPLDMLPLLPVAYVAPARTCDYASNDYAVRRGDDMLGRKRP